jgi:hypothetical protein
MEGDLTWLERQGTADAAHPFTYKGSNPDAYEGSCTHRPISHEGLPKSQAGVFSSQERGELLLAASPFVAYNIPFVNIKLPYVKPGDSWLGLLKRMPTAA